MRAEQHSLSEGTFDIDRWAAYQKTVQQKRSAAFPQTEWEAMIDTRVAFYKTLDAEQQTEVREHFTKRFRHPRPLNLTHQTQPRLILAGKGSVEVWLKV